MLIGIILIKIRINKKGAILLLLKNILLVINYLYA